MDEQIRELIAEAKSAIAKANTEAELDQVRVGFLGRKGRITQILRSVSDLPVDERPGAGAAANRAKVEIGEAIDSRAAELASGVGPSVGDGFDFTLPGIRTYRGHKHPLTIVQDDLARIFTGLGFEIVEGPEIETEYYNFIALNIPPHHPIRDEHDSFYITDDVLLRTETSAVQIRVMEGRKPPVRIVSTGRCFRRDAVDATHSHTFHQIEGLYVDKHVTMAQLKGTLRILIDELYGLQLEMRFRPDYFPFVEPGAEVAFTCPKCVGKGCSMCGGSGWLELGGAGMVHPNVLENVGYDPEEYTGFAFGLGIERIAMQKFGINDIRTFFQGDLRLLRQF